MTYRRPTTLDDALGILRAAPHRILAGGTDVFPAGAAEVGWGGRGVDHPDSVPILDITGVDALTGIRPSPSEVEIGALVTWTEAIDSELPAWFDCVRLAAREVGGRQIQNRGTLAGNLCNASPAADGVPALLALDARVRLRRLGGSREIPLGAFITGNRSTRLRPDELMTAIVIPSPRPAARSTFLKLGARRYLVISIAMVAACLRLQDDRVRDARVAVGACSEVAQRLTDLEARLEGSRAGDAPDMVREEDCAALAPLDDVRSSAAYRRYGARVLVRRAIDSLVRVRGIDYRPRPAVPCRPRGASRPDRTPGPDTRRQ